MTRTIARALTTLGSLLVLLAATDSPADAQRRSQGAGRGYFMVGVQRLDVGELNDRFAGAGYPSADRRYLSLGGGGLGSRGRLLIGGEGHGLIGPRRSSLDDAFSVRAGGGYGMFLLGYAAHRQGGLDVYPLVGFGAGGLSVEIEERSAPTFDEVLEDPRRGVRLNSGQFLVDAGLGIDYLFRTRPGPRRGGPAVGIRVGYTYAPIDAEWSTGGSDLASGPDAGFTGPYLRVMVGGGQR